MITKGLKTITSLICIYVILSLFGLSYVFGYDPPDPSSPIEVICIDELELASRWLLPEKNNQDNKFDLEKIAYSAKKLNTDGFSKLIYKPVSDECSYPGSNEKLHDNFMYRDWCEKVFDNGKYIYEAYKNIAFKMEYVPEQPKTDNWQTPYETMKLKEGDCEDAVFLFESHLASMQKNMKIIWGWVIDRDSKIARAHVWSQLTDRAGGQYIVEGFSKDWDGIIPLGIVEKTELRKPIFSITCTEFCRLFHLVSEPDSRQAYQELIDLCTSANFIEFYSRNSKILNGRDSYLDPDFGFIGYFLDSQENPNIDEMSHRLSTNANMFPAVDKEISSILKKLYELFARYEKQKEGFESGMQGTSES